MTMPLIPFTVTPDDRLHRYAVELAEYEKELSSLRARIGDSEFHRAWEEGQLLSIDEAIALAMEND